MRYLVFLFALAVTALGWVDEDGYDSSIPDGTLPSGGDGISLNIIDTFEVPSVVIMLGLDTHDGSNGLVIVDPYASSLTAVEMGTGNPVWTISDPYCSFGCCYNCSSSGWYVNSESDMYYYNGAWSVVFPNPAGQNGRGMDFQNDGNYIWETYSNGTTHRIYRIDETGDYNYYTLNVIPGQMSGLAVFPYNDNLGIFVTCYCYNDWFLYEFDGSSLTYKGSGYLWVDDFYRSYGLTYHPDTDTFFWSYTEMISQEKWIVEVEFTETTLDQSTWGSIKAQF
ncbi:MAG: hypothetical protein KAW14_11300 [Candidatus Aegiribacteria sp.]|nr:hypothetical protein [Candidatus Aegiribacteria sp.]